jgi:hypothetical protein
MQVRRTTSIDDNTLVRQQMTGFSLYMGSGPILFAGLGQGFGLGCTFVPLNLLALPGLPHHVLTQGTAIRAEFG